MASFIGRLQNILVSKWFAVILITLLLFCLSIFPIANASAQTCGGTWDITGTSGIKTSYQPGETISGSISFKINNQSDEPGVIQQILVGLVDSQNRVIDVKCIYDGRPKLCPEWTTGTVNVSWESPANPGTYRLLANQDANTSCSKAKPNFHPNESYKNIATITVSASEIDKETTTGSSGGSWPQNIVLPEMGSAIQFVIIACVIGLVIFLLIHFFRRRAEERRKLFERVCKAIEKYEPPKYFGEGKEIAYHSALFEYLRSKFPSNKVRFEQSTENGGKPDITIEHIAIEVKGPTGANELNSLITKCWKYGKDKKIIFVLFAPKFRPQKFEQVKAEIRKRYPEITARFILK
jgi:uncharacterized membrane protein YeaQ/YmgE (transglycosylase-associated protein family)